MPGLFSIVPVLPRPEHANFQSECPPEELGALWWNPLKAKVPSWRASHECPSMS